MASASPENDQPGSFSRRSLLSHTAWFGASAITAAAAIAAAPNGNGKGNAPGQGKGNGKGKGDGSPPPPTARYTPFTENLPLPPVLQPVAPFDVGNVFHGTAPEFADNALHEAVPSNTKYYQLTIERGTHQFLNGAPTPVLAYNGIVPGPTIRARTGEPVVVRVINATDKEMSVHFHGGHTPAHSDGYPNFYVLPGRARDYYYPMILPIDPDGTPDETEALSTCWYHDHAMDITAEHVLFGLAGFFLVTDELEEGLITSGVLPGADADVPIVIQDKKFNADNSIFFDPLDHDGYLGDVMIVNGKPQPVMQVQRKKYRFRFLNGANARFFELRMSNGQPMLQVGMDSWLLPFAIERESILLSMAKRADVIIDFTNAPDEVFLENILPQNDGRGPGGDIEDYKVEIPGFPLMKFQVVGPTQPSNSSATADTPLRPHRPILPSEIVATRVFEFERRNGAWQINRLFFDPNVANATPTLGTAERWILRNGGGGWWHPIHIHLEAHQQQSVNGRLPPLWDRFKTDTTILGGGDEVEVFMKFRTFKGPFVFHCHNLEHEDMRMMFTFDPRTFPTTSPQPIQQQFP